MKSALRISILLNVGLLCAWLLAVTNWTALPLSPSAPPVKAAPLALVRTAVAVASDGPAGQPEPEPFHWSRLESDDYRTYVKNLRQIGCPEPTLRAIVTADVDNVYEWRGEELEKKLAALGGGSWSAQLESADARQNLRLELQRLPDEEEAEIDELLGVKPATTPDESAATIAAPMSASQRHRQAAPVVMPLVFQNVDLSTLNLNSDQIEAIENLRQNFLDEIGGTNQDPNDPVYLARWQKAQREVDGNLRGLIGGSAFQNYQLAAVPASP